MAVKQKDKTQETEAPVQTAAAETEENATKAPRKPRTAREWEWTKERQRALHRVLTAPRGEHSILTAGKVAQALSRLPEFEGVNLTGAVVASFINSTINQKRSDALKKGEEAVIPPYLHLDPARIKPDLELFS